MEAAALLTLARRTAGLSQSELARRLGRPRSTIARWEAGDMQPPFAAVDEAVAACGLALSVRLNAADDSYLGHIARMRAMAPLERVRHLAGAGLADRLIELATLDVDGVLFGDAAGVLAGWPLRIPTGAPIELCVEHAPPPLADLGVHTDARPPGTRGLRDLRRDRERIDVAPDRALSIASPLDLLRIESARGGHVQVGALEALLEHRRRWPAGPPPQRQYTDAEAAEAIQVWLTRT